MKRQRFVIALVMCAALGIQCDEPAADVAAQDMEPTPTAAPPSPEADQESKVSPGFRPRSKTVDGKTVMPVTLPNGTDYELIFSGEVQPQDFVVYPQTFGEIIGANPRCALDLFGSLSLDSFTDQAAPEKTYASDDGSSAELWAAPKDDPAAHNLVLQFEPWLVGIPSGAGCTLDEDLIRDWIDGVNGHETGEGFLVLSEASAVNLGGPSLLFVRARERRSDFFEIFPGECENFQAPTTPSGRQADIGPGIGSWCLDEADLRVGANGSDGFIERLLSGLTARRG